MAMLRPRGVTNQTYRFPFPGLPDTVEGLTELMQPTLDLAIACEPDRVVVSYTPEYMPNGVTAASRLRSFVEDKVGVPVPAASARGDHPVGPQAINALTMYLDHSVGADQQ